MTAVSDSTLEQFERTMIPLMDSAYTLARHLLRDENDVQDVVQEAYLRAWRHFAGFRGGDGRAWLLAIVRNCCYTWRRSNRSSQNAVEYDDETHGDHEGAHSAADALVAGTKAISTASRLAIEASALKNDLRCACCAFMTSAVPLS